MEGILGLALGGLGLSLALTWLQVLAPKTLLIFVIGLVTPNVLKKVVGLIASRMNTMSKKKTLDEQSHVYSLDHGVLNLELPPKSMWMNMGYWKESPSNLATACTALLEEVLLEAGIIVKEARSISIRRSVQIVDVGFGCGDQTVYLSQLNRQQAGNQAADNETQSFEEQGAEPRPQVSSYVGVTMDERQFEFARRRLDKSSLSIRTIPDPHQSMKPAFGLFHADAADPRRWGSTLVAAMEEIGDNARLHGHDTWLLGLDSLYHFVPSRAPIFFYAAQELQASIMAFDLAFPDHGKRTVLDRLLLRIFCILTATPYRNLMTISDYRATLERAGYQTVVLRDVSEHVFAPLASFLEKQDMHLQGIGRSLGPFRVAGWVFDWWARTGLVRGYIVIAQHPRRQH